MIRNDYTQELGLPSDRKVVPMRFALPVLVIIFGVALWFGFGAMRHADDHHAAPAPIAAPAK